MEQYAYYDVLDTARTAVRGTSEEIRSANECVQLGHAELKMSVLRRCTPMFPQTHGWDSSALISYVGEQEPEGAAFRWLLTQGFIRICLRDKASIWDAALSAFENPAYRIFGAWPEFNSGDPLDVRRATVEAMRTGKPPAALPDSVRYRLELLRRLSDSVALAPPSELELPRGDKLLALITRAAEIAQNVDDRVADLLRRCTQVSDPNNRTAIDTFLDTEENRGQFVPPEVRDITNCCFNVVAAKCVSASRCGLTTPRSVHASSVDILHRTLPGSRRTDVFEATTQASKLRDLSDLEVVSWIKIREFLKDKDDLRLAEKDRQAEAAKLIAKVVIEKVPRYVLVNKSLNFLGNATIWGVAGYAGAKVANVLTGSEFPPEGAAFVIGAIAGGLSTLDLPSPVRRVTTDRLQRKWRGLLHTQQDSVKAG